MARLRTVSPNAKGWTRRRAGRGFVYLDADGQRLPDEDVDRIRSLVIPPAWEDVWICPHANGHIQAVGVDATKSIVAATAASTSSTARSTTPTWQVSNSRVPARGPARFAPCMEGEGSRWEGGGVDKIDGLRMTDCRYIE